MSPNKHSVSPIRPSLEKTARAALKMLAAHIYKHMYLLIFSAAIAALPSSLPAQETTEELTINSATLGNQGQELGAGSEQDRLANIFKLQKQLVYDLLRQAGINPDNLPPEVKKNIAKPHTKNLKAFLAFAEGLDQMDQGNYKAAEAKFKEAVALDPDFGLAQELLETVPHNTMDTAQIVAVMNQGASKAPLSTPRDSVNPPNTNSGIPGSDNQEFLRFVANNADKVSDKVNNQKINNQKIQDPTITLALPPPPVVPPPIVPPPIEPPPIAVIPPPVVVPPPVTPPPPTLLAYYSAVVLRACLDGCLEGRPPYIRGGSVQANSAVDIPQRVELSNPNDQPGFLRANVDANGRLTALTGFQSETTGGVETINIPLTVAFSQSFPSLENPQNVVLRTGFYTPSGVNNWFSDGAASLTGIPNNSLLRDRLAFAEGTATPAAALTELANTLGQASYNGTAGAAIETNRFFSSCDNCGTFSMSLDFAANRANNFSVFVAPPPAGSLVNSIAITQIPGSVVNLNNGQFELNNSNATFLFGASEPGPVPPKGIVQGGVFGPQAEAVGGTFVVRDSSAIFSAQGHFGGSR